MNPRILVAIGFLLLFGAQAQGATRIPLLIVVTGAEDSLQVNLTTDGDKARVWAFGGGLLGYLLSDGVRNSRNGGFAETLNHSVPTLERKMTLERSIKAALERKYPVFEVVIATDPNKYFIGKEIDYARVKTDSYRFLLTIDDSFTGLSTPSQGAMKTDEVSAAVGYKFRLFDGEQKKVIAKGNVAGTAFTKMEIHAAIADGNFLPSQYTAAVELGVNNLLGVLLRSNQLNFVAGTAGLGDQVPQLGKVLASYEKQFDHALGVPKGWKKFRPANKFQQTAEPSNPDRINLRLDHVIDLLIPELGQAVTTADDYLTFFAERVQAVGYNVETLKEFPDFPADQGYRSFIIDRPDGIGKELILLRVASPTVIEIYNIIFIKNFDTLYPKYRAELQAIIKTSTLNVHGT